jgi:hypothetical protein
MSIYNILGICVGIYTYGKEGESGRGEREGGARERGKERVRVRDREKYRWKRDGEREMVV